MCGTTADLCTPAGRLTGLGPIGYMGDAWDVAYTALYLASDEARYVTTVELVVDRDLRRRQDEFSALSKHYPDRHIDDRLIAPMQIAHKIWLMKRARVPYGPSIQ